MNDDTQMEQTARRRRAWLRSLVIASAAAFAGGVAVVGVQYALSTVSAGYPPAVHALLCGPEDGQTAAPVSLIEENGRIVPLVRITSGTDYICQMDAPGADYATWSMIGPATGIRSGPLDTSLPCQSAADFAKQDPARLRLSTCLRGRAGQPGLYLLSVKVMVRGQQAFDRATIAMRVVPAGAAPAPAAGALHTIRVVATVRLPARAEEQVRNADLSANFSEHGLLPQSRSFVRTVYQLAPDEEFVSAGFQARSAANASAVTLAYVPQSRSVTARFTLRSGPLIDRWRGWVSGTVAIQVRRQVAAREIALPEASLDVPGRAELPLPQQLDTADANILLRNPETGASVELSPDTPGRFEGQRLTARFTDDALVLEATAE